MEEVRQNLESNVIEFEEKAKEELQKKLEAAELNRLKVMQEKLDNLKKRVSFTFKYFVNQKFYLFTIIFFLKDEKVEQVRSIKRNSSICDDKECIPDGSGDPPMSK